MDTGVDRDRKGRELRYYAKITRQKLLNAIQDMVLDGVPWRKITPTSVARQVGNVKTVTFYTYFGSVEEAFLVLMNELALKDQQVSSRFHRIRSFVRGEMGQQGDPDCVHVYEYRWDANDRVSRGTCQKCGEGRVVVNEQQF